MPTSRSCILHRGPAAAARRHGRALALCLGTALAFTGCQPAEPPADSKAVLLHSSGSTTMLDLFAQLSSHYQPQSPWVQAQHDAGGSGNGLRDLIGQRTDIARVSRALTPHDYQMAHDAGIVLRPYIVGFDAVTIIVHPDRAAQLAHIDSQRARHALVTGEIRTWAQLGVTHPDTPELHAYIGHQASASTAFLFKNIAQPGDTGFVPHANRLENMRAVIAAVANDPWAIGIAPLCLVTTAAHPVHPLPVRHAAGNIIAAHPETVLDGSYPWSRPLNAVVRVPIDPKLARFLDFTLSPEGQQAVQAAGITPARSTPWTDRTAGAAP